MPQHFARHLSGTENIQCSENFGYNHSMRDMAFHGSGGQFVFITEVSLLLKYTEQCIMQCRATGH